MKVNVITESKGSCKACGKSGPQYFIAEKGRRKGEKFLDHSAYYKVFEQVSWFRGDDECLGKFCKDCFKKKAYSTSEVK